MGTFQWYLFDAGEKRFEFNPALSRLANPHAEVAKRRIVSERRGSADRTDSYRWQAGRLVLDGRLERRCTSGRCSCRRLKPVGRKFMLLRTEPCT